MKDSKRKKCSVHSCHEESDVKSIPCYKFK